MVFVTWTILTLQHAFEALVIPSTQLTLALLTFGEQS